MLYVDLASWGELDPDAHVALKVGDRVRVREKWRPERMPDELFRAPRARRFSKPYRDKLGDWYEDVVARAYRDEGCEVFLRSRVCGKLHDGGVDLVCVRWYRAGTSAVVHRVQ